LLWATRWAAPAPARCEVKLGAGPGPAGSRAGSGQGWAGPATDAKLRLRQPCCCAESIDQVLSPWFPPIALMLVRRSSRCCTSCSGTAGPPDLAWCPCASAQVRSSSCADGPEGCSALHACGRCSALHACGGCGTPLPVIVQLVRPCCLLRPLQAWALPLCLSVEMERMQCHAGLCSRSGQASAAMPR